jgi:hypothetical protein
MSPPRRAPLVTAVEPMPDHVLRVCFADGVWKLYDVKPLLHLPLFQPLRDGDLFQQAHVVCSGYAVAWNADIDISEYELWQRGVGS